MKYKMIMKCPDAVDRMLDSCDCGTERDNLFELTQSFVRYGEYITLEFDTKAKTVKVLECNS